LLFAYSEEALAKYKWESQFCKTFFLVENFFYSTVWLLNVLSVVGLLLWGYQEDISLHNNLCIPTKPPDIAGGAMPSGFVRAVFTLRQANYGCLTATVATGYVPCGCVCLAQRYHQGVRGCPNQ
jgi:hypothetical protein